MAISPQKTSAEKLNFEKVGPKTSVLCKNVNQMLCVKCNIVSGEERESGMSTYKGTQRAVREGNMLNAELWHHFSFLKGDFFRELFRESAGLWANTSNLKLKHQLGNRLVVRAACDGIQLKFMGHGMMGKLCACQLGERHTCAQEQGREKSIVWKKHSTLVSVLFHNFLPNHTFFFS